MTNNNGATNYMSDWNETILKKEMESSQRIYGSKTIKAFECAAGRKKTNTIRAFENAKEV